MSRSERLLNLMQALRRHRRPVTGRQLAQEFGISLRTLYRDIASLQGQGVPIEGETGLGYLLRPGFMMPPLMFTTEELEALVLGARWVGQRGDPSLSLAAQDALVKIEAVLPPDLRMEVESVTLLAGQTQAAAPDAVDVARLRAAIRAERKLDISYLDKRAAATRRRIWPFALGFFAEARVVVAWCEMRADFRHFRTDRITDMAPTTQRFPKRRATLMKEWRRAQGIDP